jgi:hypothetical protein
MTQSRSDPETLPSTPRNASVANRGLDAGDIQGGPNKGAFARGARQGLSRRLPNKLARSLGSSDGVEKNAYIP